MLLNIHTKFNTYNNNRIITQLFTWKYGYSLYNIAMSKLIIAELKAIRDIFKDNDIWRFYFDDWE